MCTCRLISRWYQCCLQHERLIIKFQCLLSMDHIDIDGALLIMANRQPERSVMVLFPDIWAEEEHRRLQNSRLNSAILPEFQQTTDELTLFSAQCKHMCAHRQPSRVYDFFFVSFTNMSAAVSTGYDRVSD